MKILFVSSSIPPETDMQTTRNMYLINSLLNHGHIVDILTCGEYRSGTSSFDTILDNTKVIRTEYPLIYRWHLLAQKLFKNTPLLKIHNVLINCYAKPDLYTKWDNIAIEYIKKHELYDYDVIISSSGSYTAHCVGKAWKKMTKKCWVAEYGDPWGLDGYGEVKKEYYNKEIDLISSCDGIVFTTQATIDSYKKHYKLDIPYCLVPCGFESILEDIPKNGSKMPLKIVYTGVAYKNSRNLDYFLRAISKTGNLAAEIVGSYSKELKEEYSKNGNIHFTGRVPYQRSLEIIQQADVLVHIGNFGKLQIPGKTYIYMSSKKPILYIQQQEEDDPTLHVLTSFPGVVCTKNTEESISLALENIVKDYACLKHEAEERTKSPAIDTYKWENLGNTFSGFIEEIVHRKQAVRK